MIDRASADELLTTTRSVRRRLDLDRPVPLDLIEECIDVAAQAPTGGNRQRWSFVVVTDPDKRGKLAEIYRRAWAVYLANATFDYPEGDPRRDEAPAVVRSAQYLADNLERVPVLVFACIEPRADGLPAVLQITTYGSIMPAAWSFMLAARARGLGSSWTTLHAMEEAETARILGLPDQVQIAAVLPVAYFSGDTFKPANRLPARTFTHHNSWGSPLP